MENKPLLPARVEAACLRLLQRIVVVPGLAKRTWRIKRMAFGPSGAHKSCVLRALIRRVFRFCLTNPGMVIGLAGLAVLAAVVVFHFKLPVTCLWRRHFGTPCPGCGMTRALTELLRGHWAAAWQAHPWSYLVMPLLLWGIATPLTRRFWGFPAAGSTAQRPWSMPLLFVVLAAFTAWALWRALGLA